ncbi:DUF992 domain-containing protein [uncultured Tateyamaria sp.]|uniref:DUF992 domain-containing protein n=1 Tax=uncultured Tateyamaria sp. TaxID=455651 RepID=UPI0026343296|nr:DUF992 domain-containing protein [uncultured Tateyamaria sp.]
MSIHIRNFAPALTIVAVMSGGAAFAQSSAESTEVGDGETVKHTEIGALTCEVEDTSALIALKQARTLDCTFDPAQEGLANEAYVGEITRFGLSVGGTQKGVMSWLVLAPTERSAAEAGLNGTYRGVSAQATLGVGVEGNVMVGGGEDQLTLQPISLGAQTGVNLALGVGNIKLQRVEG